MSAITEHFFEMWGTSLLVFARLECLGSLIAYFWTSLTIETQNHLIHFISATNTLIKVL